MSLIALAGSPAASAASPGPSPGPVVVSPRPGEIIHGDDAEVRLRGPLGDARLNGDPIVGQLGSPDGGVRTLDASISQGLRPGDNVLRVVAPRPGGGTRRAAVHFTVRPGGVMVGAGRDREAGVDGVVDLRGQLSGAAPDDGADPHWELVRAPRSDRPGEDFAPANLASPDGATAEFDPSAPGEYVFALEDGRRRDLVSIEARPRNLLVPVDTMAGGTEEPGIQIGFNASGRFDMESSERVGDDTLSTLQVLVLERATLGFVRNATFSTAAALGKYLAGLSRKDLVIVVSQPRETQRLNFPVAERDALDNAPGSIGAPKFGGDLPLRRGGLSVIGVPGLPVGAADVNVLPEGSGTDAAMRGYLTPDQNGNFGFVPKVNVRFSMPVDPSPSPCAEKSCPDKAGFRFREFDRITGKVLADQFFPTGDPATETKSLERLTFALAGAVRGKDPVELEAQSVERPQAFFYPKFQQLLPKPDYFWVTQVVDRIAELGGTKNAFLQVIADLGSVPSTTMPYALVGWGGAAEGEGAEVAQDPDNPETPLRLAGVLRPNLQSRLRPALVTAAPHHPDLADKALAEPRDRWPLQGTPANIALSYLGTTVPQLGPDPRSEFWRQDELKPSDWRAIAKQVESRSFREVPRGRRGEFDEDDFDEAQETLVQELEWVAAVTGYTERLADPFDKAVFTSWREALKIGSEVANELQVSPEDQRAVGTRYAQLVSAILKVGGALTAGVTASFAGAIDVGVWAFGSRPDGQSTYDQVNSKAVELGVKLSEQMEAAAATFGALRDVIVSDPDKLAYVGSHAFCSPASADCPPGYSYTSQDAKRVSVDASRAVQRVAYEELLPLKFRAFKLVNKTENGALVPPQANDYICPLDVAEHPFREWDATQLRYGTGGFLVGFSVGQPGASERGEPWYKTNQVWDPFVLASYPDSRYAVAPSAAILNRMFGPLPTPSEPDAYNNAKAGGLAISLDAMARAMKPLKYWRDTSAYLPFPTRCHWP